MAASPSTTRVNKDPIKSREDWLQRLKEVDRSLGANFTPERALIETGRALGVDITLQKALRSVNHPKAVQARRDAKECEAFHRKLAEPAEPACQAFNQLLDSGCEKQWLENALHQLHDFRRGRGPNQVSSRAKKNKISAAASALNMVARTLEDHEQLLSAATEWNISAIWVGTGTSHRPLRADELPWVLRGVSKDLLKGLEKLKDEPAHDPCRLVFLVERVDKELEQKAKKVKRKSSYFPQLSVLIEAATGEACSAAALKQFVHEHRKSCQKILQVR